MANHLPDLRVHRTRSAGQSITRKRYSPSPESQAINRTLCAVESFLKNPDQDSFCAMREAAAPLNQVPTDRYILYAVALRDALEDAAYDPTPDNHELVELLQSAVEAMLPEVFGRC